MTVGNSFIILLYYFTVAVANMYIFFYTDGSDKFEWTSNSEFLIINKSFTLSHQDCQAIVHGACISDKVHIIIVNNNTFI